MQLRKLAPWALALLLPASATHAAPGAGGGACPTPSNCHFTPWTPDAPAASMSMGYTTVMSGDVAAVTRNGDDSVEIFERLDGAWISTAVVHDPAGSGHSFGFDLKVSGNVLAISAPSDDTLASSAGAVHMYEKVGDSWLLAQTLYPAGPEAGGLFGMEVGLDGTWMAVGQPGGVGRVELFIKVGTDWLPWKVLATPAFDSSFGRSLAIRGLVDPPGMQLAIGMPNHAQMGSDAGAFSFQTHTLNGSGATMTYTPPGIGPQDWTGFSIDFDDEYLVVGSPGDGMGAAHVYHIEPVAMSPTLTFEDKLVPCTDNLSSFNVGACLDIADGRVVLGNAGVYLGGQGSVFVYRPGPFSGWDLEQRLESGVVGDSFGGDVALGTDSVLVGSSGLDLAASNAGGAYYFSLLPDSIEGGPCPCDSLATVEVYGTGKPGSAGVPELTVSSPPVPGDLSLVILREALVGTAPFLIWGFNEAAIPVDDGMLLVGDPHFYLLPVVSVLGQVGAPWNVPDEPILCGLDVFLQGMFLDPGASGPYHTAQSNGLKLTVGY